MQLIKLNSDDIIMNIAYIISFTQPLKFELYLLDRLVRDRNDFDIVPKRYGQPSQHTNMLRAMIMIKYNFFRFKEFISTIDITLELCQVTAIYGKLDILVLIYLHENGCPCEYASEKGQLECLKYLHENGCPWNKSSCTSAYTNFHFECLRYLYENGCTWENWERIKQHINMFKDL